MASSARLRTGFGRAALAAAVLAAFWSSLAGVFVFDDGPNIVHNAKLAPLWPPTADLWAEPQRGLSGRPLAAFSFAVDRALHGLEPRGYHVTNLVIHALAAWALFGVVRELLALARGGERRAVRRDALAFATALLWALHPLQAASVTYVVQRCESLMGLFCLTGTWSALKSFRAPRRGPWIALATACMALGALVKESIAVLPLCVLVLDVAFESGSVRAAWRARRRLYLALASVWLWIGAWVLAAGTHRVSTRDLLADFSWAAWMRTQAAALAHYARMVVWPEPVLIDHGWPIPRGLGEWLPAGLAVLAALALALFGWLRGSRAAAALLVAFLLLAPTSSVLPIPYEPWALHRMYLPLACCVGLAVAVGAAALERLRLAPAVGAALVLAAALAAGLATRATNRGFESAERLWTAHVAARPENDRAWFHLAEARREKGDAQGALAAYRRAVELHPTFPMWLNNLATMEFSLGDVASAIAHYSRAVELLPEATRERVNLVEALLANDEVERAERELAPLSASGAAPDAARRLRARVLARLGREAEAAALSQAALRESPGDYAAFETLVLLRATARDDSVRDLAAAERFVANLRTPPAQRAAEDGRLRAVVAASAGRFDEAAALAGEALERARRERRVHLAARLELELALYARREPPRDFVR